MFRSTLLRGVLGVSVAVLSTGLAVAQGTNDEVGPRFVIYDDAHTKTFVPSGWMPDGRGLAQDTRCTDTPHSGKSCVRTKSRPSATRDGWAGIAWLLDGR